jgi:aminodeoxyfutalosine synthase
MAEEREAPPADLEAIAAKLAAGRRLDAGDIASLLAVRDLIALGALADERRRHHCGSQVTYSRVLEVAVEVAVERAEEPLVVPPGATEVRLRGWPSDEAAALTALTGVLAGAGGVPVTAFSLAELLDGAGGDLERLGDLLQSLHAAGLRWISDAAVDRIGDPRSALGAVRTAGLRIGRLVVDRPAGPNHAALLATVVALEDLLDVAGAFAPLSRETALEEPSTGYDDVKLVAVTRLALPDRRIQVDWQLHGPKLAQVALTFGATDIDAVSPFDESEHGRRRAPLEEVRRNIEAAGFVPVERTGHYEVRR